MKPITLTCLAALIVYFVADSETYSVLRTIYAGYHDTYNVMVISDGELSTRYTSAKEIIF